MSDHNIKKMNNGFKASQCMEIIRLQNNRSLLAREVHFLSSAVCDGDVHGLTEIKGFVEPSEEDIEFCWEIVSMLKEGRSELQGAEKRRDIVQVMTITFVQ